MTLTERQAAVLAGVAEIEDRDDEADGPDPLQVLIGHLYRDVYEDTGEERPDLDDEAREVLEELVRLGLVEHRPPTKPEPELTETGRRVHEDGPEAVEFGSTESSQDTRGDDSGDGLLSKLGGLFS